MFDILSERAERFKALSSINTSQARSVITDLLWENPDPGNTFPCMVNINFNAARSARVDNQKCDTKVFDFYPRKVLIHCLNGYYSGI